MRILSRVFGRRQRHSSPLFFGSPAAALEFACSIAPPLKEGLCAPGVIDDVEMAADGMPFAMVRMARRGGPMSVLAGFPCKDDPIGATARVGNLCAVLIGPEIGQGGLRAMLVAAILAPEFDPSRGLWKECARLTADSN